MARGPGGSRCGGRRGRGRRLPGRGGAPLRIGVVVDCAGIYRSLEDAELSGAALPLLERGARLRGTSRGRRPDAGARRRPDVEFVPRLHRGRSSSRRSPPRCAGSQSRSTSTRSSRPAGRRRDRDARRGAALPAHGLPPRRPRPARGHAAAPGAEPLPLRRPTTARASRGSPITRYHGLGWRRVAIVLADWDVGWGGARRVHARVLRARRQRRRPARRRQLRPRRAGRRAVPRDVDGVAVFATVLRTRGLHAAARAAASGDPARRIVVGPGLVDDPAAAARHRGARLTESSAARTPSRARLRAYLRGVRTRLPRRAGAAWRPASRSAAIATPWRRCCAGSSGRTATPARLRG